MLYRSALLFIAATAVSICANAQFGSKSVVTTPQLRAELVAHAPQGVQGPIWLGLRIEHQPQWHTYWKNAGDSGLPTSLQWTLPPGVTAGAIAWPLPHKIPVGTLANYGYEGTLLLPVPLTVSPAAAAAGTALQIKLHAAWLVCKQECIPQEGDFVLPLPLTSSTALHAAAFDAAQAAQPQPLQARSNVVVKGSALRITVTDLPAAVQGSTLELFPETPEIIETAAPITQSWEGDVWVAEVPLTAMRSQSPTEMPLLLVSTQGEQRLGYSTLAKVSGEWPRLASSPLLAPTLSPRLEAALQANSAAQAIPPAPSLGWGAALLGALLGGLVLNLMPCVFPVLALKLIGFAQHAGDRRAHRVDGLAYSTGAVLSFLALGGLMLLLRAGGEQLGWGFQLQSPAVVAALALLFTVLGLNLAGLFEFGSFLPSRIASLQARSPALNAFLSGVLAVAVASPCTAPFMGASLGLAIGLPAAQALPVFAAMGLGMALPYLLASLSPGVARLLPRPGAWMHTLRRWMALPLLATVAWLVWVLAQQSGWDGAASLLALLAGATVVLWTLGRTHRASTIISIAATALLAGAIGHNITELDAPAPAVAHGRWQAWEPGRVEQTLANGQPVLVDFTAAWCITCQFNERTTLAHPAVLADLDAKKVQLLRADWTRRDPAITAALGQLGRNGVPVYVLYKPGSAPVVLTEVLGMDELRAAISQL
jgi:thiol:disulfide interchange protein/DsbC/DsbD-like thiol-disulfide interchange protein